MKVIKYVAIILVVLVLGYLFIYQDIGLVVKSYLRNDTEIKIACEEAGGNFLPKYNECEYAFHMSEEQCADLGGEHKSCESACRHDKGSMACTQQCVPVCEF